MSELITLPDAQTMLLPRLSAFAGALGQSRDAWVSSPISYSLHMDESARATIINNHWYGFVEPLLRQDPGVELRKLRGQRFLAIDDLIWLRLKRISDTYFSSNYPTRQSRAWNSQLALPPCSDMPRVDRLEFGYIPDITGTQVVRAYILLRLRKSVDWLWQVWGQKDDNFPFAKLANGTDAFGKVGYAYHDFSV